MKSINRTISLGELVTKVKGTLIGNPDFQITGICPLDEASPVHITFTRERKIKKIAKELEGKQYGAILLFDTFTEEELPKGHNLVLVKDPLHALMLLVPTFYSEASVHKGISPLASVAESAVIAPDVCIGPFCVVGERSVIKSGAVLYSHVVLYDDVEIGTNALLHARVTIREGCKIGAGTIVHCGAVIGADGFGYTPMKDDAGRPFLAKVPQVGIVEIAAQCEIGANTCIDRATLGKTSVGVSTKIDNLVQIGHNVRIGNASIICGQAAVAGSCTIGNGVVLGGNAGIADHVTIVDGVRVSAKGGVVGDLLEVGDYAGYPAVKASRWRRQIREVTRLCEGSRRKVAEPQHKKSTEDE